MGYFKNLTETSFKLDKEGNTIFFPWGFIGKGYILPSKILETKIRRFLLGYYLISLILVILIGAFLDLWILVFILGPIAILIWIFQAWRFIRGLQQSPVRLTVKDNAKKLFAKGSS